MKTSLPRYELFQREEMQHMHDASVEILENTGMVVCDDTCLRVLGDAGAVVDPRSGLVKIPQHLVEEGIEKAPKGGRIHYGRKSARDFMTGNGLFFRGGTLGPYVLDVNTGAHRPATKRDLEHLVRVFDAMGEIQCVMFPCSPCDIPAESLSQQIAEVTLENTTKPVGVVAFGRESARDVIRMAAVVAGGMNELTRRPIIQLLCEPSSPLRLDRRQGENLVAFAEHRLPLEIASMPAMCSTAPATFAGTIAQLNAEHLCMVLIAQLVNPGTPISLNACAGCMDPKTGMNSYGAVERVLLNAGVAQLWRSFYGLETYASAALTDSKALDEQAGYERMMNMLLPALVGVDMITTLGYLESYLTISSEQVVIDNEIAGMLRRILGGIEISQETLAVDVISKVGPGQHFLAQKHTLKHVGELFIPMIANRNTRAEWRRLGEKDVAQVAREEAKHILETHQPEPLDESIQRELREIASKQKTREAS